jgi:phage shock protein A
MKYLTPPTTRLPDNKLVLDRAFVTKLVDAVNQLNDEVKGIHKKLADLDAADKTLSKEVSKAELAISKTAAAVNVLIGGTNK